MAERSKRERQNPKMAIKIAIIDSGVKKNHPAFQKTSVKGFSLQIGHNGKVNKISDFTDTNGHGTAVFYLINSLTINKDITNIKIYFDNLELTQNIFESFLSYICDYYQFDIINISMGITNCTHTNKLQKICDHFYEKGTIIISAFDNDGAVSFPAALNHVIGVDGAEYIDSIGDYITIERDIVNVVGKMKYQKVAWIKPDYNIVKGNSFTCCYITAIICRMVQDDGLQEIQRRFFSEKYDRETTKGPCFRIENAVVFPFNKEIHVLASHEKLLPFNIKAYYSVALTGQIGRSVCSVLGYGENTKIIQDIENIDWSIFDTLILGHIDQLNSLSKRNYGNLLLSLAKKHDKYIYSFDGNGFSDEMNSEWFYAPEPKVEYILKRNGKLFQTNIPILCVCGTNSKQGKYSLQLYFRKRLMDVGYKVGQLGTEPTAILFGMDEVFHCGYNQHLNFSAEEIYLLINQMIWNITDKEPEIILAGCQSGLLPYNNSNVQQFPTIHRLCLEAIQPDAIILCINPFDDIEYVKRTINVAEGITGARVIGGVCFPSDYLEGWSGRLGKMERISFEKEQKIKDLYKKQLGLEIGMLDNPCDLDNLLALCLQFLSR